MFQVILNYPQIVYQKPALIAAYETMLIEEIKSILPVLLAKYEDVNIAIEKTCRKEFFQFIKLYIKKHFHCRFKYSKTLEYCECGLNAQSYFDGKSITQTHNIQKYIISPFGYKKIQILTIQEQAFRYFCFHLFYNKRGFNFTTFRFIFGDDIADLFKIFLQTQKKIFKKGYMYTSSYFPIHYNDIYA